METTIQIIVLVVAIATLVWQSRQISLLRSTMIEIGERVNRDALTDVLKGEVGIVLRCGNQFKRLPIGLSRLSLSTSSLIIVLGSVAVSSTPLHGRTASESLGYLSAFGNEGWYTHLIETRLGENYDLVIPVSQSEFARYKGDVFMIEQPEQEGNDEPF